MFKVICTLPNASDLISGVAFEPAADGGMVSASPVDEDVAARFAMIPGYNVVDLEAAPATEGRGRMSAAEVEAIRNELTDLGIAFPKGARPATLADLLTKAKADKAAKPPLTPAQEAALDRDGDGAAGGSLPREATDGEATEGADAEPGAQDGDDGETQDSTAADGETSEE